MKLMVMKYIILVLGFILTILFCATTNINTLNTTSKNLFIGKWELKGKGYGDIVPPVNYCCEFVEFQELVNSENMSYSYIVDSKVKKKGAFAINTSEKKIVYKSDSGKSYTYNYSVTSNVLEISYVTDNNVKHSSKYTKVN